MAIWALWLGAVVILTCPGAVATETLPDGVWLMDGRVALQIFNCGGLLCGRILWLQIPRDPQGQLSHDKRNPDPALRARRLCGLTILWALRSDGRNRWEGGWLYNPDDGKTYRVSAKLSSPDLIVARVYLGIPFFGETKTLARVPHGTAEGWC
ncbi:MAG TPA: DUF2147 domain-containing protein [Candidatus Limnocylindria bacterium]|jgi:uncharacterized protein (DUF2147 family)|nr:DUF2147 domain-containing protein [Candidatus Limnocylindria bacterium]